MKFSKAYEPNQFEPDIYALWESSGAFKPSQDKNSKPFSIVMPPPNANGNLHIGHGLTIALEDIMTRYHRLQGDNTWYIPGADHAGFETWVVYERKLESEGKSRFDFTRDQLYGQVWDFVHEQRGNMELQLRSLGASCDWSSLTFTLDDKVVSQVYDTFKKMWDEGLIYRGEKLVNFCTKHQTAFADIEVVHRDEAGTLWDIAYPLVNPTNMIAEIVISTTRPETLLGDTAVAVNPNDERYKDIIGKKVKLPLTDREIPIIADEHADMSFGTGAVKITPAHDHNDYEVGERHNLPAITVIGFDGKMTSEAGANFENLTIEQARKKILTDLNDLDLLRGEKAITHAVSHCYKCDTVIEPLLKEQWFINVKPLAEKAISALKEGKIHFHPANKKKILINYLENLKDWNISRQIPWGIPIPAFHDRAGNWIFDTRVDQPQIEIDGVTYTRDEDTFDTWFSSGQWPIITTNYQKNPETPFFPTSVMETGSDILFPWVSRMIMLSLFVTNDVPFKDVYLHGLVLDERGQKMSKSKGNVINPMEVISEYGSDAFRLGITSSRSAGVNQAFSASKVIAGRNLCNKLWNVSRFVQALVDETENKEPVTTLNMGEDWICRELNDCKNELDKLIQKFRFAEAGELLYDTIWNKYADWFIESQKIYKNTPLLKITLDNILIMLHPFAPFVTETIWQTLSWTEGMIINQKWPEDLKFDPMTAEEFVSLITVISTVRSHFQNLPGGKKYPLLFGNDSLVNDNQILVQFLTHATSVIPTDTPRGMRVALPNRELYLDIDPDTLSKYRNKLESDILSLGQEIDRLNLRLMNPNYTEKAPRELVDQTEKQLAEKQTTLERLKQELTLI